MYLPRGSLGVWLCVCVYSQNSRRYAEHASIGGFCFFNAVACAARAFQAQHAAAAAAATATAGGATDAPAASGGRAPVLIVDFGANKRRARSHSLRCCASPLWSARVFTYFCVPR